MPESGFSLTGDRLFEQKLAALADPIRRRIAGKAVTKLGQAGVRELKKAAPESKRTGTAELQSEATRTKRIGGKSLKRSMKRKRFARGRAKDRGFVGDVAGPSWPDGAHAHLIELGYFQTTVAFKKPDGSVVQIRRKTPKWIPGTNFMRQSIARLANYGLGVLASALRVEFSKEAAKLGMGQTSFPDPGDDE